MKLTELEALAKAADDSWYEREQLEELGLQDDAEYLVAANPTTILELIALVRAVENLVKVKGRYHSEKAYIALCDAFDELEGGE